MQMIADLSRRVCNSRVLDTGPAALSLGDLLHMEQACLVSSTVYGQTTSLVQAPVKETACKGTNKQISVTYCTMASPHADAHAATAKPLE